jgi:TIR domain
VDVPWQYRKEAIRKKRMAYNVFISYSTKNLKIVNWLRSTLHRPGMTEVFAAEYSVSPSQPLNDEIERAIRACNLFVLLWSHDARSSEYVPQEIGLAKGCNKRILPIVMDDNLRVPGFISNLKYLPAHKDWEGSFKWLKQFVDANSQKLKDAKALGAIGAVIIGIILLSGGKD